jgi:UDP-glucose 4-epimerase
MVCCADAFLVTGGAGFVGSWLVAKLLAHTDGRIVVLDNLANGRREFVPVSDRVVLREEDLTDAAAVRAVVHETRPSVVFHLAALHFIPYCNAHPAETLQVNVLGTQHLFDACRLCEPSQLVMASTAAVYPIRDGANTEDDPVGPTDIYGLSKWSNEHQLELFARQTGTRCAAARLFNVIGPHETNPHVLPEILDQIVKGHDEIALGNVKPKRDYVYVADVAEAFIAIASRNTQAFRTYNVGTGHEYSVEEIVDRLALISGRPLKIAVASQRVRPSDRMHLLCDRGRIEREIGWQPRFDLDSGLTALWQSIAPGSPKTMQKAKVASGALA